MSGPKNTHFDESLKTAKKPCFFIQDTINPFIDDKQPKNRAFLPIIREIVIFDLLYSEDKKTSSDKNEYTNKNK